MLAFALAACGAREGAPSATILAAAVADEPAPTLTANLRVAFSPVMLEALERGIPLRLAFALQRSGGGASLAARPALTLSYAPLAQQYLLVDDSGAARSFARRTQLLAALDRVRVPLPPAFAGAPAGARYALRVRLDDAALPGPLRLPALVSRDWRLATDEHVWRAPG